MLNISTTNLISAKQTICQEKGVLYLLSLSARKVAIIASKRSVNNYESIHTIQANVKKFETKIFNPKWNGEPQLNGIIDTVSEISEFSPDWIVAIGGGSIIDGTKVAWALYENPNFDLEKLKIPFSLPQLRKKAKFVAVPTTAGTGSETSSSAILTDIKAGNRFAVVTHDFLPDLAILDINLLENIPQNTVLIPSMLDALSHSLEGLVSKVQNKFATNLVSLAVQNITRSLKNLTLGNKNYIEMALIGSFYGGIIQNLNLVGPAHALAHNIPKIHHGIATGLLLPSTIEYFCKKDKLLQEKYNDLSNCIGYNNINDFLTEIYQVILKNLKFGIKISEHTTLNIEEFDKYANNASKDMLAKFFPTDLTKDELLLILRNSY